MKVTIEAQSDVGRVRELNEDSFRVVPTENTVIVCDGMGGHAAGEVASGTAAETIAGLMQNRPAAATEGIYPQLDRPLPEAAVQLAAAVRVANRRVYNAAAKSHKLRGMGTTVVAAVFGEGLVATAHVGDSRAYRITGGGIEQLTTDHSWIAELVESGQVKPEDAENFADKNVITRALGTRPNVQVDVGLHPAQAGDLYLLCSDGICGYVSDQDILDIVNRYRDDLAAAVAGLIDAANAAGGLDNSTVALVRIEETETTPDEYDAGTITLPEENDAELEVMDRLIAEHYPELTVPAPTRTGTRKVPVDVEAPETSEAAEDDEDAGGGGGFRWGLAFLFVVVVAALAWYLWPRLAGTPETVTTPGEPIVDTTAQAAPPATEAERPPLVSPPPAAEVPPDVVQPQATAEALVYLVAFGEARTTGVYWDGVYQGRVSELEMGMIVDPGRHQLVVISKQGDTLMDQHVTVLPNDTLDLEVK